MTTLPFDRQASGNREQDQPARSRVLVADDDPSTRLLLRRAVERAGFEVVEARDGEQAWTELTNGTPPQLAILDWVMPGIDGLELCRRLRALPRDDYVYVVLLSAHGQQQDLLAGLQAGAEDYLRKPFDRHELEARLLVGQRIVAMQAELLQAKRQLWLQASHDSLTGVWNRRGILEILQRELARTDRWPNEPVSVLLADVDHFKRINDTCGHPAGDGVLETVAQVLAGEARSYDAVGRYGGEEFLVVLPRTSTSEARLVAERLRMAIEHRSMPAGVEVPVRMSFGVASTSARGHETPTELLEHADQALYSAKRLGRNRVEVASPGAGASSVVPQAAIA